VIPSKEPANLGSLGTPVDYSKTNDIQDLQDINGDNNDEDEAEIFNET